MYTTFPSFYKDLSYTTWKGECISKHDNSRYPFLLSMNEFSALSFSGTILWSSLNNAKTRIHGLLDSTKTNIEFEEYAVICGEDEVEIPMKYKGTFSSANNTIEGHNITTSPLLESTFVLKLQPPSDEESTERQILMKEVHTKIETIESENQKELEQMIKETKLRKEQEKERKEKEEKEKKEREEKGQSNKVDKKLKKKILRELN